ncbi:MAG: hypothetical protein ACM3ZF_06955, partial [Mycobacterium leprae]
DERRFVAAGERAYELGSAAGRYPAMGFHTRGEMGGIWTPPIKLLDGLWFGVDGRWVPPATRFASGYGYVRMTLPGPAGVRLTRTDFAPDERRAVHVGLTVTAARTRRVRLVVDAHSELMSAYPWGATKPGQLGFDLPDTGTARSRRLVFRDVGRPPTANASRHDWAAIVGASLTPDRVRVGRAFRGPQDPPVLCPPPPRPDRDRCDDSGYGKGAGGQLGFTLTVPARTSRTVWVTVAGSDQGLAAAQAEYAAASVDPAGQLRAKVRRRLTLAARTRLELPGDRLLAAGVEWGKQNLADLTQQARGLQVRRIRGGTAYPPPAGRVDRVRFVGAGFPDYPWLFATDGEYTAFALVAAGRFDVVKDHLRALRAVSEIANNRSGKVVHEVVTTGDVYVGLDADPGNIDETAKFPSTVALLWRWTGDNRFRDEMYDFVRRNLAFITRHQDVDGDLWPHGLGNVEASGLGEETLDVTVYTLRGLHDLADMAASRRDTVTERWALGRARAMERRFEGAWWMPAVPQYADSLDDPGNVRLQQRWWIGITPMEVEHYVGRTPRLGLAVPAHAAPALELRMTRCYTGRFGLYVQGAPGCDPAPRTPRNRVTFSLNTALMAVALGNYGRLDDQRRYTDGNARLVLGKPDEQPGAMPETAPSPEFGRNVDLPFTKRSMVMQAWGHYGTLWPVVHQQLGVRPDLGRGRLEVVPQLPPGRRRIAATNIRLGAGSLDVTATHDGAAYTSTVTARTPGALAVGVALPAGARVRAVTLNGGAARYAVRATHRGAEVLVAAAAGRPQRLVVRTG